MDTARLIGDVFRETGVAVEPGDPVLVSAAISRIVAEEDHASVRQMLDEMRRIAAALPRSGAISPEAERDFVARAAKDIASETRQEIVYLAKSIKLSAWFYSAIAVVVIAAGMLAGGYYWGARGMASA